MGAWIAQRNELLGKAVIAKLAKRNMKATTAQLKKKLSKKLWNLFLKLIWLLGVVLLPLTKLACWLQ